MLNVEGFFTAIRNAMGLPLGVSYRKSYGLSTDKNPTQTMIFDNPYADVICDITADDVCRGEEPVSYAYELPEGMEELPDDVFSVLESFKKELNSIVKWVSKDLQAVGVSVYNITLEKEGDEDEDGKKKKNPEIHIMPNVDNLLFYLTKDKRVVAYDPTDNVGKKKNLEDVIIFINYDKNALTKVDENNKDLDKSIMFEIKPTPMQFKNAQGTLDTINLVENALKRYRAQLSRIVRYATVDVGLSNGDTQKDVVEAISSAINADSINLTSTTNEEYNDNIPVIPTRNGKGEPQMHLDVPSGDIKELADLKYYLDKLNLITRFPATYMDFSQAMGSTAASMIRSDLRYAKLCASIRTLIEKTINEFIEQTESLSKYNVVFSLVQLPTSEDDDVLQAMSNYSELAGNIYEFVMGDNEEESLDMKIQRLNMVQGLYNASVKSPVLQKWFDDFNEFIEELKESKQQGTEMGAEGEGGLGGGLGDEGGGGDLGGDLGGGGLPDLGEPDFTSEDLGGGDEGGGDIETFEPQTEG